MPRTGRSKRYFGAPPQQSSGRGKTARVSRPSADEADLFDPAIARFFSELDQLQNPRLAQQIAAKAKRYRLSRAGAPEKEGLFEWREFLVGLSSFLAGEPAALLSARDQVILAIDRQILRRLASG